MNAHAIGEKAGRRAVGPCAFVGLVGAFAYGAPEPLNWIAIGALVAWGIWVLILLLASQELLAAAVDVATKLDVVSDVLIEQREEMETRSELDVDYGAQLGRLLNEALVLLNEHDRNAALEIVARHDDALARYQEHHPVQS